MVNFNIYGFKKLEYAYWPNISRSKGNQTMKFGQLVECNMRNIFLEKSCIKYGGRTSPRPFHKKSKLSISLIRCITLDFTSYKAFSKNKKRSGTSSWTLFSAWFSKKNWPNFIVMCIVITCCSGCDVIMFEINLSFLVRPFLYMTKKVRTKILENENIFSMK